MVPSPPPIPRAEVPVLVDGGIRIFEFDHHHGICGGPLARPSPFAALARSPCRGPYDGGGVRHPVRSRQLGFRRGAVVSPREQVRSRKPCGTRPRARLRFCRIGWRRASARRIGSAARISAGPMQPWRRWSIARFTMGWGPHQGASLPDGIGVCANGPPSPRRSRNSTRPHRAWRGAATLFTTAEDGANIATTGSNG